MKTMADKKYNETMIIRNGNLLYAVSLKDKAEGSNNACHIYIENGRVNFGESFFRTTEFDFANESHRIAKEIFITQLQADIKRRVLELKQLQSVFSELNLQECFGSVLEDNTKLLLEVKTEVEKISDKVKENVKIVIEDTVEKDVKKAIKDTVKPIALNKDKEGADNENL